MNAQSVNIYEKMIVVIFSNMKEDVKLNVKIDVIKLQSILQKKDAIVYQVLMYVRKTVNIILIIMTTFQNVLKNVIPL